MRAVLRSTSLNTRLVGDLMEGALKESDQKFDVANHRFDNETFDNFLLQMYFAVPEFAIYYCLLTTWRTW
jgi:hypothetical protein